MKNMLILMMILTAFFTGTLVYVMLEEENSIAVRIIDGDTFMLSSGETVRLLEIDAPEKGDYYYNEAKEKLAELIKDKEVYLEKDKTGKDRYGRLLRYAYANSTLINLVLVEGGYAKLDIYEPDIKYKETLEKAERIARVLEIGIWAQNKEENICCTALGCPKGTLYVGSRNSDKFHECCSTFARMISKENLVCFRSENEAVINGYEGEK